MSDPIRSMFYEQIPSTSEVSQSDSHLSISIAQNSPSISNGLLQARANQLIDREATFAETCGCISLIAFTAFAAYSVWALYHRAGN